MGGLKAQSECQKAMVYYYDYLSKLKDQVPEAISAHIQGCQWCQREIHLLEEIDLESDQPSPETLSQTAHLELHFALVDQPIQCSDIRAFLPVLALPEQQVTIPTPVTVHIAHCRPCSEELKYLQGMDLSVMEYGLVSQMFSEGSVHHADLFNDSQVEVFSGILNRPDSGVVTTFHLLSSNENDNEKSYEVKVSTHGPCSERDPVPVLPALTEPDSGISQQRSVHRKWFIRPVAAAAVLMMGVFLLLQNSSVKATDISQIYETLKTITNIRMVHYGVDTSEPTQQIWVSRSLGMKMIKTGDRVVLFDTDQGSQYTKTLSESLFESTEMTREMLGAVGKTMDVPWGLLPFKAVGDLPKDAVWRKSHDPSLTSGEKPYEIFDLFWTEETVGSSEVSYQWRCILDPVTKRPIETQWWSKLSPDTDYELTTRIEIRYPDQARIQTSVSEFGFDL